MKILDQRLVKDDDSPFRFQPSPNIGQGKIYPKYLVIHYSEGASLEGTVIWLTNKESGVSSHLAIGRDGTIVQMVPFDRIAWHAGVSTWAGLNNLNRYSIGIELDNAGMLTKTPPGWKSWFNHLYPDDEVIQAIHQFGTVKYGWQTFTAAELQACRDVAVELVKQYDLQGVLGHDEIAPKRKWDPGPAFPMQAFRDEVMALAKNLPPPQEDGTITVTPPPATIPPAGTTTPPVTTPPAGTTTPPATTQPGDTVTPVDPGHPAETILANRIPLVEYHNTEYTQGPTVEMHTDWFLAQLKWLSDNGFKSLSGDELVHFVRGDSRPPQKSFALRFDLGAAIYQNLHDVVLPALEKYSFRAFFFVLTSMARDDNTNGCVSWSNLLEWEGKGLIEAASHGVYHPDYQQITPAQRLWDARESKRLIELKLGHPISFFGFPKDSAPAYLETFLQAAGYSLGFAGPQMERSVLFKDYRPYALPCYYPYSDPKYYPAINGMKGLDFGGMIMAAVALK